MLLSLAILISSLFATCFQLTDARLVKREITEVPQFTLNLVTGLCEDKDNNDRVQNTLVECLRELREENYYKHIPRFVEYTAGVWIFQQTEGSTTMRANVAPAGANPMVYYVMNFPENTCTLMVNGVPNPRERLDECHMPTFVESRFYYATITAAAGNKERRCVEFYKYMPWNMPRYVTEYNTKALCESAIAGTAIPLVEEPRSVKIASAMLKSVTIDPMPHSGKNAVVSPLALELAAAVCVEGATEGHATQTQLLKSVFQLEGATALANFKTYAAPLVNIHRSLKVAAAPASTEKLGFANFFALDTTAVVNAVGESFDGYKAKLEEEDLAANAADVVDAINDVWKTARRPIAVATANNLLANAANFGVDPKVVLVNSLYAKLDWAVPFSAANDAPFYPTAQRGAAGPNHRMMAKAFPSLPYGETSDMEWIRVPFKDADYNMYFVLPKSAKTVADLKAPGSGIGFIMENPQLTSNQAVDVTLPRFNIDFVKDDYENVLKVTAPAAFNAADVDFTPMLRVAGVPITKVRHVVNLQVYEDGINGVAVANPVAGAALAATPRSRQFVANHPFLFFVTGTKNDRTYVLFAGQFYNQV